MRRALRVHPAGDRGPVTRIEADIRRLSPRALALTYELTGQIDSLRIPPPARPGPADGLWKHSCFEAFVGLGDGGGYLEFNLSPSGQWAAYRFDGYRAGMTPLADLEAPRIVLAKGDQSLTLKTVLELPDLPDLPLDGPWRLGLSAVVEDSAGRLGYWALAHPPGKPDFHHPEGFACEVRAPEAP